MFTDLAPLDAARTLASPFSARAREAERACTMPADLVADVRRAGLFNLTTPRILGGLELPPQQTVEVIEEVSRADGSAGWTILIGNATGFLAWLDPHVAAQLLAARTDTVAAGVFAPMGRFTDTAPGTFRLDGRWGFASGSPHADWFWGGGFVLDGPGPRIVPGHGPDWRLGIVPTSAVTIVETWDCAGLRGTGSHDVVVDAVPVPHEHTIAPFREPARHDGPLWRLPFFTFVGTQMVGFPLGVARRALDELTAIATAKARPPSPLPIGHDGDVQIAITRAEAALQSARALVVDALGGVWESALAGNVPDVHRRARFLLATQNAMRTAVEVVTAAVGLGGTAGMHADHPLQRCLRDIHAADQHIYFSQAASKRYAMTRLGIEQDTSWF
ncbi:acyl-CoA dehydrogenase family protein [Pseudonocardia sp. CA-107938]|uniref:acyl-CoA dehydrogenase family protein n=1 Tax=Pseudonocardia sp. CA-107938 TaxID=3240021 RepID=UPI003D934E42